MARKIAPVISLFARRMTTIFWFHLWSVYTKQRHGNLESICCVSHVTYQVVVERRELFWKKGTMKQGNQIHRKIVDFVISVCKNSFVKLRTMILAIGKSWKAAHEISVERSLTIFDCCYYNVKSSEILGTVSLDCLPRSSPCNYIRRIKKLD